MRGWTRESSPSGVRRGPAAYDAASDEAVVRGAPALAALLESLTEDGRHSILDLGAASGPQLAFLGRFARRIRFAGLVPWEPVGAEAGAGIDALAPYAAHPYDVVLAWDVLDHLEPTAREGLITRLAEITAPHARLYALVSASTASTVRSVRSTILARDRVSMQPIGTPRPSQPLLPAAVERLLAPFEITHAYTLRVGLRAYVATKRDA